MPTPPELEHVHRFLPGQGENAGTTLVLLHGTGGDENDMVPLAASILPGAAVLSPRGAVREGNMPRFFKRLSPGVFDLEDLRVRTQQLIRFVRGATDRYTLDRTRMIAVGLSNGANIAASVLLTEAGVFSHAVLFRAMVPFKPTIFPQLAGTPVLIASGEWDSIATPEEARHLSVLLTVAGANTTLNFVDSGHELTRADVAAAADWIQMLNVPRVRPPPPG
jgi:predicted esterase